MIQSRCIKGAFLQKPNTSAATPDPSVSYIISPAMDRFKTIKEHHLPFSRPYCCPHWEKLEREEGGGHQIPAMKNAPQGPLCPPPLFIVQLVMLSPAALGHSLSLLSLRYSLSPSLLLLLLLLLLFLLLLDPASSKSSLPGHWVCAIINKSLRDDREKQQGFLCVSLSPPQLSPSVLRSTGGPPGKPRGSSMGPH